VPDRFALAMFLLVHERSESSPINKYAGRELRLQHALPLLPHLGRRMRAVLREAKVGLAARYGEAPFG